MSGRRQQVHEEELPDRGKGKVNGCAGSNSNMNTSNHNNNNSNSSSDTLRVQVPNNHILTHNLYYNYYHPKPKVPKYWVLGPSGIITVVMIVIIDAALKLRC